MKNLLFCVFSCETNCFQNNFLFKTCQCIIIFVLSAAVHSFTYFIRQFPWKITTISFYTYCIIFICNVITIIIKFKRNTLNFGLCLYFEYDFCPYFQIFHALLLGRSSNLPEDLWKFSFFLLLSQNLIYANFYKNQFFL